MRAYFTINAKKILIPFDHRDLLLQTLYGWMGYKETPKDLPPYSFSRFEGPRNSREGMSFNNETAFFFSSPDTHLVKQLCNGAKQSPDLFHGLTVKEVELIEDPDLKTRELFYASSPLLLKADAASQEAFIVYNSPNADELLKAHTLARLEGLGIVDDEFDVFFDKNYVNAGTKKITYRDQIMRASWCQVILKGLPETKRKLWHIGLGDYTALGFGAIM